MTTKTSNFSNVNETKLIKLKNIIKKYSHLKNLNVFCFLSLNYDEITFFIR